jgi:hypothetical protein
MVSRIGYFFVALLVAKLPAETAPHRAKTRRDE